MSSSEEALGEERDRNTVPVRLLLFVIVSAVFVIVMNGSMVNVALPTIGEQFGVSEGEALRRDSNKPLTAKADQDQAASHRP